MAGEAGPATAAAAPTTCLVAASREAEAVVGAVVGAEQQQSMVSYPRVSRSRVSRVSSARLCRQHLQTKVTPAAVPAGRQWRGSWRGSRRQW